MIASPREWDELGPVVSRALEAHFGPDWTHLDCAALTREQMLKIPGIGSKAYRSISEWLFTRFGVLNPV